MIEIIVFLLGMLLGGIISTAAIMLVSSASPGNLNEPADTASDDIPHHMRRTDPIEGCREHF